MLLLVFNGWICSNNRRVLLLDIEDRRNLIIQTSSKHRNDKKFWSVLFKLRESINDEDEESSNESDEVKKEQNECEVWINEHTQHNDKYDYVLASDINSTSLNKQLIIELWNEYKANQLTKYQLVEAVFKLSLK